ncbi:MAG TPA: ATP-binding cassette domain-containing protein [Candidatus Eisenbacteria bacterium]|nr:ATP-binding cassette domain-containing protein [Candidatus Eisenbacteria bacterium]
MAAPVSRAGTNGEPHTPGAGGRSTAPPQPPVVEAVGVWKSFGRVEVLRGVNIAVGPGEIVALVGDNGAGKSTLLKILSGVESLDAGEIRVDGRAVEIRTAADAHAAGLETVYQDLALAPHLDVSANLFLGRETVLPGLLGRLGFLDNKEMRRAASDDLQVLGLRVREGLATSRVVDLSGGQQQAVAVARALTWGRRLLILDEPTAALGVRETAFVLDAVLKARDERGLSVLLVTHDLPSALRVADRVVVLRLGRESASFEARRVSVEQLVGTITGVFDGRSSAGAPEADEAVL